jgi:hypothetical protein
MTSSTNISFHPDEKIIKTNTEDLFIIYSEWKRWVLTGMNAMYFAAFEFVDGKPNLINDWKLILEY